MGIETALLVVGTVIAAGSAAYQAYSASEAADEQEKVLNQQADMEKAAADSEAAQIREKGRRLKAAQTAQLAGAGVKIDDSGTAGAILQETDRLSEQDALAALREGENRASIIKGGAKVASGQSQAALIGGALGTAGTILGGVSSYQKATAGARTATTLNTEETSKGFVTRSGSKYSILGGNYSLR